MTTPSYAGKTGEEPFLPLFGAIMPASRSCYYNIQLASQHVCLGFLRTEGVTTRIKVASSEGFETARLSNVLCVLNR